ncbi:growth/differentiation factor 10 [Tiliqua scincoides]|uniref:growth/differentiation factor 10 n=1 Tax=Tiliqua scincoides TaxID=71010 RepID=UPI00346325BC
MPGDGARTVQPRQPAGLWREEVKLGARKQESPPRPSRPPLASHGVPPLTPRPACLPRAPRASRPPPRWGYMFAAPKRGSALLLADRRMEEGRQRRRPPARPRAAPMAARLACCCCLLLWSAAADPRDRLAAHMQRIHARYGRLAQEGGGGGRPARANTVRGFRARLEMVAQKPLYCFNLSSIQDSEVIVAATFHFFSHKCKQSHKTVWKCSKNSACRLLHLPQESRLSVILHSFSENFAFGELKENITVFTHRLEAWQAKDISHFIKQLKQNGELILCAELDSGEKYHHPASHFPYILVYANDLAISEPNSVAFSLQRYDPFPSAERVLSLMHNASVDTRMRRDIYPSSSIHNNVLPEEVYVNGHKYNEYVFWESTYKSHRPKASRKKKGQENPEMLTKSQLLSFDEKTMKKARQEQWDEPTICSRRYLKVDFADIGWNEWIISPKSFDAYYCAGTCKFPMPKIVRPSNHATIQSIVKAVGIIPGIPEPCCVPNTMNSLGVLFLDESKNIVLKMYPNMSVKSCACQ